METPKKFIGEKNHMKIHSEFPLYCILLEYYYISSLLVLFAVLV